MNMVNPKALVSLETETTKTRRRYDQLAAIYDLRTYIAEATMFRKFRQSLWSRLKAKRILELGVGTGANIPYYPKECHITAVDLSEQMLERAKRRAEQLDMTVDFQLMDAQHLTFPDNNFDAAVTTCVFCSVPDPIQGLRELGRVVKPGGHIWLMEHMRVDRPIIGPLMDFVNPLVLRMMGANINRRTVENVRLAGLEIESVENLAGMVFRLIHAHPNPIVQRQPCQLAETATTALSARKGY